LSVCCGFSEIGMPMGMQIIGRAFDEPMVLKVGDAYQQLTNWHTRTPAHDLATRTPELARAAAQPT
jgi:aspartyl-tRNA(Asn)/glutamyl-tRNA(Gln) amidotransferase subunit A